MTENPENSFRDAISTVDEQGKRVWLYPKKPGGRFFDARKWVSYGLLALLFAAPFIRIGGNPLLLLDVMNRKFVILGQVFWPQDTHLFLLAMITLVVFIIVFTVVYGRIFCGWVCPQTIFMEMVFRRIEYWIEGDASHQKKLNKGPWTKEKIRKKVLKNVIFFAISFLIANTFLAYFIGSEKLIEIITDDPSQHVAGLSGLLIFTGIFFGVFMRLREQVCTTICPYGRLQGVLLDRDSVVIAYDHVRGENRSKFRKNEDRSAAGKGDCIDCNACVAVCPTGIDIRNGTQLECINCTACIDACDHIMDKIGLDRGLIRYASENQITENKTFSLTKRAKAYTVVLGILIVVMTGLLILRSEVETSVLRTPGMLYEKEDNGYFTNLYNFTIVNKTNFDMPVTFKSHTPTATIEMVGANPLVEQQGMAEGVFFIRIHGDNLDGTKNKVEVGIYDGERLIETVKTNFIGPFKQ
ncbi:cytochrome c oxidase accessory protein CcoG [Sanyastnella coralliicola]|uniref:cytochrome c oxidase accessory protein CcoG n=1 Tax=Sanyastnella coralliicola TaxID=3069118 RepID=UPI0027B93473|nr:cytochrome c oxidase accessory protein CcoG [Longitalea sp. SCSIO 12813]